MTLRGKYRSEFWPGRNRFCCRGRCITGSDQWGSVVALLLLLVTGGMFFGVTVPYLVENNPGWGAAGVALGAFGFVVTLASFFLTVFDDPGIVPRQYQGDPSLTPYRRARLPRRKEVEVDGERFVLKFCETCQLYRPPRCSHCSTCNNCVERFDHHCPWVGNCIGRRNYRTFYVFVVACCLLSLFVLAWSTLYLVFISQKKVNEGVSTSPGAGFANALGDGPTAAVLVSMLTALFGLIFTGSLSVLHTVLIFNNKTTAESFKYAFGGRASPFEPKGLRNWALVVLGHKPPSKVKVYSEMDATTSDMIRIDPKLLGHSAGSASEDSDDAEKDGSWADGARASGVVGSSSSGAAAMAGDPTTRQDEDWTRRRQHARTRADAGHIRMIDAEPEEEEEEEEYGNAMYSHGSIIGGEEAEARVRRRGATTPKTTTNSGEAAAERQQGRERAPPPVPEAPQEHA